MRVTDDYHYEVSKILGHKGTVGQKSAKYLVRWVGFDIEDMQWISEAELKSYSPKVLKSYITWAKKHKRMTNNVPEFAHVDELEAADSLTEDDGPSAE